MKLRSQRALMFLQHGRHEDPLAELRTVELYIADSVGYRIRRIGSDGIITKVAGATDLTAVREGVPALTAEVGSIAQMQVGPDGALYRPDGLLQSVIDPPSAGRAAGYWDLQGGAGRGGERTGAL